MAKPRWITAAAPAAAIALLGLAAMAAEDRRHERRRASTTRTVDTHVVNLRKKLEDDPAHPRFLQTVYGRGYRLTTG